MNPVKGVYSRPAVLFLLTVALGAAFVLAPARHAAAMGVTTLPAAEKAGPDQVPSGLITIWYPSSAPEAARAIQVFNLSAAWDGPPIRGNGGLILLSHGSGGSATTYYDLARVLVDAGFVVAAPEHDGDNWKDHAKTGPESWKQRPAEISRAIDRVQGDARFARLLEKNRVGVFGMSAGGLTVLEFSGANWSLARLVKHCADHFDSDTGFCAYREMTSGKLNEETSRRLKADFDEGVRWGKVDAKEYGFRDDRVKAVVSCVPVAAVIDPASIKNPRVATALIAAEKDLALAPQWHVGAIRAACKACVPLDTMKAGGHLSILSPLPEGIQRDMGAWAMDPPGFDRASLGPLYKSIAQFFLGQVR